MAKAFSYTVDKVLPPTTMVKDTTFVLDDRLKKTTGKRMTYVTTNKIHTLDSQEMARAMQIDRKKQEASKEETSSLTWKRLGLGAAFTMISGIVLTVVVRMRKQTQTN